MASFERVYPRLGGLQAKRQGNAAQMGEFGAGLMLPDLVNAIRTAATRQPLSKERITEQTVASVTALVEASYTSAYSKEESERKWQSTSVAAGISSNTVFLLGQALSRMSKPEGMVDVRLLEEVDTFMVNTFGAREDNLDNERLAKAYDVMHAAALFLLHEPVRGEVSYKYNPDARKDRAKEKIKALQVPEQFADDPLKGVIAAIVRDPNFFKDSLAQQLIKLGEKMKGRIEKSEHPDRSSWQAAYVKQHAQDTVIQGQEVAVVAPEPLPGDIAPTSPALRREHVLAAVAIQHEVPALISLFGQFLQNTPAIRSRLVAEGQALLDRPEYRVMKGLLPHDENTYLALALQALQEIGKPYKLSPEWEIGFHSRETTGGNTIGQAQIWHFESQGEDEPPIVTYVNATADMSPNGYLVQNGRASLSADVYEQGAKAPNLPEVNNPKAVGIWVETLAQLERAFTPPPALPEGNN